MAGPRVGMNKISVAHYPTTKLRLPSFSRSTNRYAAPIDPVIFFGGERRKLPAAPEESEGRLRLSVGTMGISNVKNRADAPYGRQRTIDEFRNAIVEDFTAPKFFPGASEGAPGNLHLATSPDRQASLSAL